ncbi:hypothetical protein BGZ68_008785 [Mortierella alpina]|nr:hypothetical protein BGZ68_008785 [Mortierella alpina]
MSNLASVKVFETPELASLVANHLKKPDLIACAVVSRALYEAVIPFIYRSVIIGKRYGWRQFSHICWEGFQKHSSHMRELTIDNQARLDISLFGINCTNLTVLQLIPSEDTSNDANWFSGLMKLISNNPGISTLRLITCNDYDHKMPNEIDRHLTVLCLPRYIPGLKKLVINSKSIGTRSVNEILRCSHRLEELDLATTLIYDTPNIFQPRKDPLGFDLESFVAGLSLKDHDAGEDDQDGPYILDFRGHRCRQGTSLKKFRFILPKGRERGLVSADTSLLLRLCCSAECINLHITGNPTRSGSLLILRDQVGHHAWRLKHLDIGPLRFKDSLVLTVILRASKSSLDSFRLWNSYFGDELLLTLLENHCKTLKQVTFGKCTEIFRKTPIEALLSQCPNLQMLHVYNCAEEGELCMTMTEDRRLRWISPEGQIFKVFTSDQVHLTPVRNGGNIQFAHAPTDEGTVPDALWRRVDMMHRGQIKNHIRFLAN